MFQNFSEKIHKLGGVGNNHNHGEINKEYVGGQTKDIIAEVINNIKNDRWEDYRKIRECRLRNDKKLDELISASNISDYDYQQYEDSLFGDQIRADNEYQKKTMIYPGYDAANKAYGPRSRYIQEANDGANVGEMQYIEPILSRILYGSNNPKGAFNEEMEQQKYELSGLKPRENEEMGRKIDFRKVMEYSLRNDLNLMYGNKAPIDDLVDQKIKEFNHIDVGDNQYDSLSGGPYQAGLAREEFLENIIKNRNDKPQYEDIDTVVRINPDVYYDEYGYNIKKVQSAMIDKYKTNDNDSKLHTTL